MADDDEKQLLADSIMIDTMNIQTAATTNSSNIDAEQAGSASTDATEDSDPKCVCGKCFSKVSDLTSASAGFRLNRCSLCGFHFNLRQSAKFYYKCEDCEFAGETIFFCVECAKHRDAAAAEHQAPELHEHYDRKRLFFVLSDGKRYGPITKSEIISLYVRKVIKPKKLYITNCETTNWIKLQFQQGICDELDWTDTKRCDVVNELKVTNAKFKEAYPEIYKALIMDTMLNYINPIKEPTDMPKEEMRGVGVAKIKRRIGQFLGLFLLALVLVHVVPVVCVFCCLLALLGWYMDKHEGDLDKFYRATHGFAAVALSGAVITPITVVLALLLGTEQWDEIQSWMVLYIAWGTFLYALIMWSISTDRSPFLRQTYAQFVNISLGVDFGHADVIDLSWKDDTSAMTKCAVGVMIPALASVLPATICAFIANFMLEPRFELKCSADNLSGDICFDEGIGCCEVISSHELDSSYSFLGGLTSHILSSWAVLRVCGYVLVQGYPELTLFASRTK